jgi:hypothetical protein
MWMSLALAATASVSTNLIRVTTSMSFLAESHSRYRSVSLTLESDYGFLQRSTIILASLRDFMPIVSSDRHVNVRQMGARNLAAHK